MAETCGTCQGWGWVYKVTHGLKSARADRVQCPTCAGTGKKEGKGDAKG